MMTKIKNITYKVFFFERVKKKIRFLDSETYPLQIRLSTGGRTIYLKSYFFKILSEEQYKAELDENDKKLLLDYIISAEKRLMDFLLSIDNIAHSPELVRQRYAVLCRDTLYELDRLFKVFLIDFFTSSKLPAYALFIENNKRNFTSEFILKTLEKSLHPGIYGQLKESAAKHAPPYIPLIQFFRNSVDSPLPLLPLYTWQQEDISRSFEQFVKTNYPAYNNPSAYIDRLLRIQ